MDILREMRKRSTGVGVNLRVIYIAPSGTSDSGHNDRLVGVQWIHTIRGAITSGGKKLHERMQYTTLDEPTALLQRGS